MKVREIVKIIENDGWVLNRTKGSHRQFKHQTKQLCTRSAEVSRLERK